MAGILAKTYNTLSASTALAALVSTRIYPEHALDAQARPYIIYFRAAGGERVNSLKGYVDLENVQLEVSVYATDIDGRRAIADQVILDMNGSTRFRCDLFDPPFDDYDPETRTYERVIQFSIWNHTT